MSGGGFDFTVGDAAPLRDEVFVPEDEIEPLSSAESTISTDIGKINQSYIGWKKFVENPQQVHDEYEYKRSGSDPGLVVIFNQLKFDDEDYKKRTGTNRDVNELILTFGRLGYNVDPSHIHTDLTRKEILQKLEQISKQDHSDRNSLILAVLTHGDTGDQLQARDGPVWTREIWEPFSAQNCPSLHEKPKFFIFQACKGQSFSQRSATQTEIIPNAFYTTPWEPDMLVAFAAVEGSQSYRHMLNGTWFIQEMCRNFSAFGRRDDVVSLLIRTTKCVATNYFHVSEDKYFTEADSRVQVKKQMPLFVSTLTKKFYLTKSKDRNLMLRLLQQQQEIVNTLQDVQKKVDVMYENYQGKKKQRQNR